MVKTPWSAKEIPFHEAAQIGTEKVISQHSTIGIVMTTDGSFGEIPRENFISAEERTIEALKKQEKPFIVVVNSQIPYKEETQQLVKEIQEKYKVSAMAVNCEQLRKEDVSRILEKVLYEFPVSEIRFFIPKWVEILPADHEIKAQILSQIQIICKNIRRICHVTKEALHLEGPYVQEVLLEEASLATGIVRVRIQINDGYYYKMLSALSGVPMESEYELRSEERRVGKECRIGCRSRWSPDH